MIQKLSKCCHAPVDDLIEVDQSWSTICRKCQHRCEVEEPTQAETLLGDKKYQELAIRHAAELGARDQEIALLKGKLEAIEKVLQKGGSALDGIAELQSILTPSPREEKSND